MIHYKINFSNHLEQGTKYRPGIDFEDSYIYMNELNSCDTGYILDDILPNLERIMNGEQLWEPHYKKNVDYYLFGYDATIIEFMKEESIIHYDYGDKEVEVPSQEIYDIMQEWGRYLREWKAQKEKNNN